MEINPTSLQELSKPSRTLGNLKESKFLGTTFKKSLIKPMNPFKGPYEGGIFFTVYRISVRQSAKGDAMQLQGCLCTVDGKKNPPKVFGHNS